METDYYLILSRLLYALLAGGLIGMERSIHGREAGFRTHTLVCVASSLLMMLMAYQWHLVPQEFLRSPGRHPGHFSGAAVCRGVVAGGHSGAGPDRHVDCLSARRRRYIVGALAHPTHVSHQRRGDAVRVHLPVSVSWSGAVAVAAGHATHLPDPGDNDALSGNAAKVAGVVSCLDQRAAEHVGSKTRFPSLTIGSDSGLHGGCQMSWTRTGTRVPPIPGPRELFHALFVQDGKAARQQAKDRIALQGSILDAVLGDANSLKRRLNQADRHKLDEYFSSVRDVEIKLQLDRH